jgi:hypothetical protein
MCFSVRFARVVMEHMHSVFIHILEIFLRLAGYRRNVENKTGSHEDKLRSIHPTAFDDHADWQMPALVCCGY